ncbi:MAG: hypothetical protein FWG17_02860 [Desulfovibrionaceae bacterium]|nr:hypothetical protein [Desulfovibrionaceae bacterium]
MAPMVSLKPACLSFLAICYTLSGMENTPSRILFAVDVCLTVLEGLFSLAYGIIIGAFALAVMTVCLKSFLRAF